MLSKRLSITCLLLVCGAAGGVAAAADARTRPNIIVILADDMGFSDLGCYGGEIETPHLDRLARGGLRFTQFYNCGRCCPTRASLLTGLYPHQAGIGHMTDDRGQDGYRGDLNPQCVTLAEVLRPAGYSTSMVGKWHVTKFTGPQAPARERRNWPLQRGFDRFCGFLAGTSDYFAPKNLFFDNTHRQTVDQGFYTTDAFVDEAIEFLAERPKDKPFFLYTAFNAPHFPVQAPREDIERYRGRYKAGWDALREQRHARQIAMGIVEGKWPLSPRPKKVRAWNDLAPEQQDRFDEMMAVYAACVARMDRAVGRLVDALEQDGCLDDTLILFLSDNGGNAETGPDGQLRGDPSAAGTKSHCGESWANLQNTPFREFKHFNHEGGIATPLIAHWPAGIAARGELRTQPGHLIDIMPTCVAVAGATYPAKRDGEAVLPMEGVNLLPAFAGQSLGRDALFWEHEGNAAVRVGDWKLVRAGKKQPWELYNLREDRTELANLAAKEPARAKELQDRWESWAERTLVTPYPQQGRRADDEPRASARRPNVVYMLADDLGWGDIGRHGGPTPTPAIDRLFASGVELTQCMGWCVCSPTRAMLLTGRHPFRVGTGPEVGGELEAEETTIAEVFQAAGYRTGAFGKWHNGEDPDTPEYRAAFAEAWKALPNKKPVFGLGANAHGFDEAWVYYGGGADFFTRRTVGNRGPVSWWHNRAYRPDDEGYTEDLITARACEFIRESAGRPFFCYVPFHLVHAPMQAKPEDLAAVDAAETDPDRRVYAAMVRALDGNVAKILSTLDELGLRDDTIVVFTSDNGATLGGRNLPLRGTKHTLYEGGVRLPTVIHWPRGGLAGRSWDGLCSSMDMLPTLASLAGVPLLATRPLDGRDVSAALRAGEPSPVESVYWAWHGVDAIRTQQWKLHRFFDRAELYDLRDDPGEARNLAAERPEVVADLTPKLDAWAAGLSAALSHQPPRSDAAAAPAGDGLEISVTVTDKARPADQVLVHFATLEHPVQASDHVEFDLAVMPDSLPDRFFYTPFKRGPQDNAVRYFKRGDGVDQFGREQVLGPAPRGASGRWERRVVGLCSYAPGAVPLHGMVFTGGRPGRYTIRLDNLQIRHADGSTTPIWTEKKHTRFRKQPDTEAFTGVSVEVVPVGDTPPTAPESTAGGDGSRP